MTSHHITITASSLKLTLAEITRKRREAWVLTGKKPEFVLSLTLKCETAELTIGIEPEEKEASQHADAL